MEFLAIKFWSILKFRHISLSCSRSLSIFVLKERENKVPQIFPMLSSYLFRRDLTSTVEFPSAYVGLSGVT